MAFKYISWGAGTWILCQESGYGCYLPYFTQMTNGLARGTQIRAVPAGHVIVPAAIDDYGRPIQGTQMVDLRTDPLSSDRANGLLDGSLGLALPWGITKGQAALVGGLVLATGFGIFSTLRHH